MWLCEDKLLRNTAHSQLPPMAEKCSVLNHHNNSISKRKAYAALI